MLSGQWASLPGGRQPAGGGGPAVAPSAAPGRPGFTSADLQRNPFLGSAYVRTMAADESMRLQSAAQAAAGIEKAVSNGLLPRPEDVALVNQTGQQYPEKFGPTAEKMNGQILGGALAQMEKPQRDQVLAAYRAATDGQDQHHMNVAAAALDQYQKSEKNLAERPYQEAATRGWIAPVSPIDPGRPDTIAGAMAERVAASQRIAAMNHTPAPPILDKGRHAAGAGRARRAGRRKHSWPDRHRAPAGGNEYFAGAEGLCRRAYRHDVEQRSGEDVHGHVSRRQALARQSGSSGKLAWQPGYHEAAGMAGPQGLVRRG